MRIKPEILAPAGDEECIKIAVGAGADAVYFGLASGFNARAKAPGISAADLPRIFSYLHERGVKGYITFNVVVYDSEIEVAREMLTAIAQAGADAVIVQDLGVARFCHELAPSLGIHASTQMTVSSPEGARIAKELGVKRVVLPRELSVAEIRRFKQNTDLELECFVHGALCVSYSGQCLTSEAWGQRSANRGQCAQSCRLPYDFIVDGKNTNLGLEKYLLSPKDLSALDFLPDLVEAGISCFKIEGRYKGADYVAAAVEKYRKVLDAYWAGRDCKPTRADYEDLSFTYSRGFSPGWLKGDDHQELSHGVFPGHRGLKVGTVTEVRGYSVFLRPEPDAPAVKAGDWIVFDQGNPEGDEPRGGIFSVGPALYGKWDLRFGDPGPDLRKIRAGDGVWKSHDSEVKRRMLRYLHNERKIAIDLDVGGAQGFPLTVKARDYFGRETTAQSEQLLQEAHSKPLDEILLRDKLGAFGDSRYYLNDIKIEVGQNLAIAPSELKRLRRVIVAQLEALPLPRKSHAVSTAALAIPAIQGDERLGQDVQKPALVPLCRTLEQVEAALDFGAAEIYLDFMELVGLKNAVQKCRDGGARVVIATMRIQKPGEEPIDKRFESLAPDGILARHLGALEHYRAKIGPAFSLHGDFSLNAANALTARILLGLGLKTLTPSYDLNFAQLKSLSQAVPATSLEITIHQHLPLYHTEYCVYAHNLSKGKDFRDCGRPCEEHRVSLKDGKGLQHPVLVDVGCRNTVFNAKAQSAAEHLNEMLALGLSRFRVEFVWESGEEVARVLRGYDQLLSGKIKARELTASLKAVERYGVSSGTLAVMSRPSLPVVAW